MTPPPTRLLAADQEPAAAAMLARAFQDNPMYRFFVPADAERPRAIAYFMACVLRVGRLYGQTWVPGGSVDGAATWLLPGATDLSPFQSARAGLLGVPFKLGWQPFKRIFGSMDHLDRWHKQHAPEPHYYLLSLGTEPARQRTGVGSALIAPMLARADSEQRATYLETDKPENLVFYRKHGFDVVAEGELPGGGPRCWGLRRPPKNS